MKKLLEALFESKFDDFDISDGRAHFQRLFINSLSIIGTIPLVFFSVYNIFFGIQSLGLWEALITFILILNFFLFQKHQNIHMGSIAILLIMILLSLVLLATGGIENTGVFWLFIFPVLAFFLQGTFYGFLWVLFFIAVNLTAAFLAEHGLFSLSYSFIEIRQFLISLLTLSLMVYFYEKVVDSMNRFLQNSNTRLEEQVQLELHKNREKDFLMIQQSRQAQIGEMVAMIAHQWRQPLSSITATTGSLQMKQAMGKYDKEYFDTQLQHISEYSQQLSRTIEDFRDFYAEDTEVQSTNLEDIIQSSISVLEPIIRSNHITLTTDFHLHENFFSYPNELKQVMLNLIKNSQEALINKQIKDPKILISTYKDGNQMCFQIEDNAGGISSDIIDKIFDPYFTTKSELHGSGLGLYMSKKIINDHCQGTLSVENTDEGVRFICSLPRINNDDR